MKIFNTLAILGLASALNIREDNPATTGETDATVTTGGDEDFEECGELCNDECADKWPCREWDFMNHPCYNDWENDACWDSDATNEFNEGSNACWENADLTAVNECYGWDVESFDTTTDADFDFEATDGTTD